MGVVLELNIMILWLDCLLEDFKCYVIEVLIDSLII